MAFLWLLLGYLIGSISSAILICRVLGHPDPRTVGSGNPGTTNVLRHFGKFAAAMTLVGDVAKGFVPVIACAYFGFEPLAVALTGVGAFVGHLYPVYFGFVGGKGVATIIGVLLGFHWILGLAFIGCWIAVAMVTRYSSLAALLATTVCPVIAYFVDSPLPIVLAICTMAALVIWRHQSNIKKLIAGTEDKIGGSPTNR